MDQMQTQMAQAQALRAPTGNVGGQIGPMQPQPGMQTLGVTPPPNGMQTLNTPLDPSQGMQMQMPPQGMQLQRPMEQMPPQPGMRPPGGWGRPGAGQPMRPADIWRMSQQGGMPPQAQGYGAGGRFGGPGGPNGMNPQMQAMPGQAGPLPPQGTIPSPAGAARPGTPPGAPNLYR